MLRPPWERGELLSPRLSDHSEADLGIDARTDFIWKERNIGRENDGRRLDDSGIGVGVSGALRKPLCAPGDSLTRSLEKGRESFWIGVP